MSSGPEPTSPSRSLLDANDNAYGGLWEWLVRCRCSEPTSARRPLFDGHDNACSGLLEWLTRGDSGRHPRWL